MAVYGTLVNADASGQTGVRNFLINGDMRIWQKGTDLNTATTGDAKTTVDRWTSQYADFAPRIRKVEDTLTTGETVDTAEITKISGSYASCEFTQKVETTVAKYLRGKTVTFSFWIKKIGSTFGSHNYDCWIGDSETADDTVWTNSRTVDRGRATRQAGISAAVNFTDNTWRKITITRTLSSDTNTIYCTIYTQSTPTNEGVRITNCQLELGSISTPFEVRPYAMELAMCQRYYFGNFYGQGGVCMDTSTLAMQAKLPVSMRAAPTFSLKSGSNVTTDVYGGGGRSDATIGFTDHWSPNAGRISISQSAGGNGRGNPFDITNDNMQVNAEF
jgi:hypothetical protein